VVEPTAAAGAHLNTQQVMGPGLPYGLSCDPWTWYTLVLAREGDAGCTRRDGHDEYEIVYIDSLVRGTRTGSLARRSSQDEEDDVGDAHEGACVAVPRTRRA